MATKLQKIKNNSNVEDAQYHVVEFETITSKEALNALITSPHDLMSAKRDSIDFDKIEEHRSPFNQSPFAQDLQARSRAANKTAAGFLPFKFTDENQNYEGMLIWTQAPLKFAHNPNVSWHPGRYLVYNKEGTGLFFSRGLHSTDETPETWWKKFTEAKKDEAASTFVTSSTDDGDTLPAKTTDNAKINWPNAMTCGLIAGAVVFTFIALTLLDQVTSVTDMDWYGWMDGATSKDDLGMTSNGADIAGLMLFSGSVSGLAAGGCAYGTVQSHRAAKP